MSAQSGIHALHMGISNVVLYVSIISWYIIYPYVHLHGGNWGQPHRFITLQGSWPLLWLWTTVSLHLAMWCVWHRLVMRPVRPWSEGYRLQNTDEHGKASMFCASLVNLSIRYNWTERSLVHVSPSICICLSRLWDNVSWQVNCRALFAFGSKCMNSPGHKVATPHMLPMTRDMRKRRSIGSQRTALFVSVIVAAMNGSNAEVTVSCTGVPTFPGGCNPNGVLGACYSTEAHVNWACGASASTDCRRVRLPPGQSHRPNLRRNYDGYCSFGETDTRTSSTMTSSTATTLTATVTSSSTGTTSTTSSTVTWTTTLPHPPPRSPVARHGHLRVVGNQIVGEHNQSVRLRGMSLFWSQWGGAYWNEETLRWLRRDWGIELIRAAMGVEPGAYLEHPKREMRKVKRVVWAAHQLGIYVIVDWHDHHANRHTSQAKRFFNDIAKSYGHMPNVLFETFNEPTWQSWSREVKPYHEEILKVIRRHSQNIVIAGTPTWSQDVDVASTERVDGGNIAYTLHFYAATHGQFLRDIAKRALDRGVALFVSEWGTCEANGNGGLDFKESKKWLDFLAEYNVSDANWAVNDKKESCSALRPGAATNGHWRPRDLTRSGRWVRRSLRIDAKIAKLRRPRDENETEDVNMTNSSESSEPSNSDDLTSTSEAERRLHFSDVDLPTDAGIRCQAATMAAMIGLGLLQIL